jgi:hypothetical protein
MANNEKNNIVQPDGNESVPLLPPENLFREEYTSEKNVSDIGLTKRIHKIPNSRIIEGLKATGGFIGKTAKLIGLSQSALSNRIKQYPELREVISDIENNVLEVAVSGLISAIANGDPWAIKEYLKYKGHSMGFGAKENNNYYNIQNNIDID